MKGNVFRHHRCADLLRLELRHLLVQRADFDALGVVEHRRGDRARDVVERVFRGRARVDDGVELPQIHAAILRRASGSIATVNCVAKILLAVALVNFCLGANAADLRPWRA